MHAVYFAHKAKCIVEICIFPSAVSVEKVVDFVVHVLNLVSLPNPVCAQFVVDFHWSEYFCSNREQQILCHKLHSNWAQAIHSAHIGLQYLNISKGKKNGRWRWHWLAYFCIGILCLYNSSVLLLQCYFVCKLVQRRQQSQLPEACSLLRNLRKANGTNIELLS